VVAGACIDVYRSAASATSFPGCRTPRNGDAIQYFSIHFIYIIASLKRTRRPTARGEAAVGDTDLARRFYAGRYGEIVASHDAGDAPAPADLAFVVGALTFVDRVDEARALFDGWRGRAGAAADARTLVACRFFVGLALARAGYFDRSAPLLVAAGFRARHAPDRWVRALVFQGLACQCYFTGRYAGAGATALRALSARTRRSSYAAMLGTDLRGHALAQLGQLQRGTRLTPTARPAGSGSPTTRSPSTRRSPRTRRASSPSRWRSSASRRCCGGAPTTRTRGARS
jgi:hypothetical protein